MSSIPIINAKCQMAQEVYDILETFASAPHHKRANFIQWFAYSKGTQFRFGGILGRHGIFSRTLKYWRVQCKQSDYDLVRRRVLKDTNAWLRDSYRKWSQTMSEIDN